MTQENNFFLRYFTKYCIISLIYLHNFAKLFALFHKTLHYFTKFSVILQNIALFHYFIYVIFYKIICVISQNIFALFHQTLLMFCEITQITLQTNAMFVKQCK
jgi:hypothetical protein